jgi:hypothetical protein
LNVSPAEIPGDPVASARSVQAAFDGVKEAADKELAKLLKVYEAPLRRFSAGGHAHSRWIRWIATTGGFCSQSLQLEGGELGIHLISKVPEVVQAVFAVQVAAFLVRTMPGPKPSPNWWSSRAELVRQLSQGLGAWPGTLLMELGQAVLSPDKLEALAAEPLSTKPGEPYWSEAVVADLARTKARVLLAYLHGKVVGEDVLHGMSRFRYQDEESLFVLIAGLATDALWKAQRPKLAAAIARELKRHSPATGLRDLQAYLLAR